MEILVFGGTTEGKKVISMLNALRRNFVYSTKTKVSTDIGNYGKYRNGEFTVDSLTNFIEENQVKTIIHAAHPFAEILHKTIAEVTKQTGVKVLRLERNYPVRTIADNVVYCDNYKDVLEELITNHKGKHLLALTGVQSIAKIQAFWKETKSFFRILDRQSSIDIAKEIDFPMDHLILEEPENLIGNEEELIRKLDIQVIVTKESGDTGALSNKIEIALRNDVPILILKKPELPASFHLVNSVSELEELILNDEL